ncbi:hypothetical protein F511_33055 [Dorcoceras hygrometricum]|uniref:Uncharacterized protein n=1 Tax=Dorcoceras hygrometricum TaxID=472368 RepID=A0A2Z7C304_9LAMI|nr:hypothetical protein F511_33055 [Dorcoceras hygrometricum]
MEAAGGQLQSFDFRFNRFNLKIKRLDTIWHNRIDQIRTLALIPLLGNRGGSGSRLPARQRKNKNWAGRRSIQFNNQAGYDIHRVFIIDYLAGNSCLAPTSFARKPELHGITDSACKNQLVVVSVQYGPFNPHIPFRLKRQFACASPYCSSLDYSALLSTLNQSAISALFQLASEMLHFSSSSSQGPGLACIFSPETGSAHSGTVQRVRLTTLS